MVCSSLFLCVKLLCYSMMYFFCCQIIAYLTYLLFFRARVKKDLNDHVVRICRWINITLNRLLEFNMLNMYLGSSSYLTPLSLVSFRDLLGTCLGLASYMKRIEIYPEYIPKSRRKVYF